MKNFRKILRRFILGAFLISQFHSHATYAQIQKIEIVDSIDLKPIPFATITFSSSKKVYSANEQGLFYYPYIESDTLSFSCIGYNSKKVIVKVLKDLESLKLTPSNILLPETSVESNSDKVSKTSSKGRFKGMVSAISGQQYKIGITFDSLYFGNKTVEYIHIYIPKGGNWSQPFRIRFYRLEGGVPTNEFIEDANTIRRAQKPGWNKFDLSNSPVKIPPTGCIIAVEWLDFQNIDESKFDIKSKNFNLDFQQYKGQYLGLGTYKSKQISGQGYFQTVKTNKKWISSDQLFNNYTSQKFKDDLLKPLIAIEYY